MSKKPTKAEIAETHRKRHERLAIYNNMSNVEKVTFLNMCSKDIEFFVTNETLLDLEFDWECFPFCLNGTIIQCNLMLKTDISGELDQEQEQ